MDDRFIYGKLNQEIELSKPKFFVIEITPDRWNNGLVDVEVEGIDASSLIVCFSPVIENSVADTDENSKVYAEMRVYCVAQAKNQITFGRVMVVDKSVFVGVWAWL